MGAQKSCTILALALAFTASTSALLVGSEKIVVEVLLVLDKVSWNAWNSHASRAGNSMDDEIFSVMYEVNKIYEPLGIEIRLKEDRYIHLDYDLLDPKNVYGNNQIDYEKSTQDFWSWMRQQNGLAYDSAVFIVGYDLSKGSDTGNGGYAYRSSACRSDSVALVEGTYDMRMIVGIAHEVAHTLGSFHDGEGNTCDRWDGYIMTDATSYSQANFVTWSSCSQQYIDSFIKTDQSQCLRETNSSTINSKRFGLIAGGEETCRRRTGTSTYVSRLMQAFPTCQSLTCETRLTITDTQISYDYESFFTPAGMPCADGKLCNLGQCVKDSDAPSSVEESCLFGDTPYLLNAPWYSCADVWMKGACSGNMALICCGACN